jgi:SAM-dependent methyltransferase
MTGFAADWLALREPADRRARSAPVLAATRLWAGRRATPGRALRVVDLGAGTGGNLRCLAPHLSAPQAWTLVDDDPGLLALAQRAGGRGRIAAMHGDGSLRVRAIAGDLAAARALTETVRGGQLITASALFDLTSAAWCRCLVRSIAHPGMALHAALTYDGRIAIEPADPLDGMIRHLFNSHQHRGKGFGAALGPRAAPMLARVAAASGAIVIGGHSDWRLGRSETRLIEALFTAWTTAAREMLPEQARNIDAWGMRRRRLMEVERLRVVVGHLDLLAIWPGKRQSRTSAAEAYPLDSAASLARRRASHAATLRRASTT